MPQYYFSRKQLPAASACFAWCFMLISFSALSQPVRVKDVNPGPASSNPVSLTHVNGTLFFGAQSGSTYGLWKSNGTEAGTVAVKNFVAAPSLITPVNNIVYFAADDGVHGTELWKSDGTAAGTVLVKDITPGPTGTSFIAAANVNGTLFFSTLAPALWKSDGTAAGTVRVAEVPCYALTNFNGTLYYISGGPSVEYGAALGKSDGTAAGTVTVKQLRSSDFTYYGGIYFLKNVNGTLYTVVADGAAPTEYMLWKSDGTESGTVPVELIWTGSRRSSFNSYTFINNVFYFSTSEVPGYGEQGLYTYDLTTSTLTLRINIDPQTDTSITDLTSLNNTLYFVQNSSSGKVLMQSDGTAAGTVPVSGSAGTQAANLTPVGGTLYFSAGDSAGVELWKYTPAEPPVVVGFRINAGGASYSTGEGKSFVADAYFTGGKPARPATGEVARTEDDALYHTGRYGDSFGYNLPTGNGQFDVILHFNETYWGNVVPGGAGSRRFHVDIEGQRKLTNYDILAKAGGAMKAVREIFRTTVADGSLHVLFTKGSKDFARIEAIEVIPVIGGNQAPMLANIEDQLAIIHQPLTFTVQATDTDTPAQQLTYSLVGNVPDGATIDATSGLLSWTPAEAGDYTLTIQVMDNGTPVRTDSATITVSVLDVVVGLGINAGGYEYYGSNQTTYFSDNGDYPNSFYAITGETNIAYLDKPVAVANTPDDFLYRSERWGNFSYHINRPNGTYDVVLHFAEVSFGYSVPGGVGSRRFHVDMEGQRKLTDYDIFSKAGGALKAVKETFRITLTDGTIDIDFIKGLAGFAKVSAIEVLPATDDPAPVFYRAINLNGNPLTLEGHGWEGKGAPHYYTNGKSFVNTTATLIPNTDEEMSSIIRSSIWHWSQLQLNLTAVPSGTYQVYLYVWEDNQPETFSIQLEGETVEEDYYSGSAGFWQKLGPYPVTCTDGSLNVATTGGAANFSGIEVWKVNEETNARIAAESAAGQVTFYPNPVQHKLTVQLPFPARQVRSTALTDAVGHTLLTNAHQITGETQLEMEVSQLPKGFYLLRLHTPGGFRTLKVAKE